MREKEERARGRQRDLFEQGAQQLGRELPGRKDWERRWRGGQALREKRNGRGKGDDRVQRVQASSANHKAGMGRERKRESEDKEKKRKEERAK